MSIVSLTWKHVWARRLARHSLLNWTPTEGLVQVVSAVCGIHAQVMPAAELSLGIRVDGVTRRDVEDANGIRDTDDTLGTYAADFSEQPSVRLLPHFDCYVIGCHPRDRLLPPAWADRVPPRTTPSQLPVLLVNGTVAGLWERQTKGGQIEVRVEPFDTLDARPQRLLEEEAGRIGAILGAKATLTISPITVRPHL